MCHLHPNAIPRVMITIHYKDPCSHCILMSLAQILCTYIKLLERTNVYIVLQNTFVTIEVRDRFGQQCNYR